MVLLWIHLAFGSKSNPYELAFNDSTIPLGSAHEHAFDEPRFNRTSMCMGRIGLNFNWNTQTFQGTSYIGWNAAVALDMFITYSRATNTTKYQHIVTSVFNRYNFNFDNKFYDDMGWWTLVSASAYETMPFEGRYLQTAKHLFDMMTNGVDTKCGGGLYWLQGNAYKNSITNNLYTLSAFQLYKITKSTEYLAIAKRGLNWFESAGLLGNDHIVLDGLDPITCQPGGEAFTYNQGIAIGMYLAAYQHLGSRDYLTSANNIARAAINKYTQAVLADPGEDPHQRPPSADQSSFKGIFMNYLYKLYDKTHDAMYKTFIDEQANAIWALGEACDVGISWGVVSDAKNAATIVSGTQALLAQSLAS
jgi:predicted alpha-1,6-mannanase (GH76 family)